MIEINKIHQGDCLELMKCILDKSIDLILCDLPYGTTACSWDSIIDLEKLWEQYKRIIRNNGFIILFGSQPFTTKLINSNIEQFSHQWIWQKEQGANPLLANLMPMKNFEDILVFYNEYSKHDIKGEHPQRLYFKKILDYIGLNLKQINKELGHRKSEHSFYVTPKKLLMSEIGQGIDHATRIGSTQFNLCTEKTYNELINKFKIDKMNGFIEWDILNKQNLKFRKELIRKYDEQYPRVYNPQMIKLNKGIKSGGGNKPDSLGTKMLGNKDLRFKKFPTAIIKFNREMNGLHPTQKPVALFEYLLKTYSNKEDLILDNCIGSGTTAIACKKNNRKFIGIELEKEYVEVAERRLCQNILSEVSGDSSHD